MIRILRAEEIGRLLARRAARMAEAEAVVRPILEDVRRHGDRAMLKYARKFDGFAGKSVRVEEKALVEACAKLPVEFRAAVGVAAGNISRFAGMQLPAERSCEVQPGLRLGQVVRPLETVAAYIPAGRYPLPSTLMMTV